MRNPAACDARERLLPCPLPHKSVERRISPLARPHQHSLFLTVNEAQPAETTITNKMAPKKSNKTSDSINAKLALTIKVRTHRRALTLFVAKQKLTDLYSLERSLLATSRPSRRCALARPSSSSSPATPLLFASPSSSVRDTTAVRRRKRSRG